MTRMRLRELRKARGMSQAELARILGVTKMAVSRWENGLTIPTSDKLPSIAALMKCDVTDLYADDVLRAARDAAERRAREKAAANARAPAGENE